jgi:hypothetical protein
MPLKGQTLDRQPIKGHQRRRARATVPVYLAGARLLEVFPVLPLLAKVALSPSA